MMESFHSSQDARLEATLVGMIAQGRWRTGDRLPPERSLAEEFGVSRNTLRGVLKRLEARGMVAIRQGSGCYLASPSPRTPADPVLREESEATVMARFEAAFLFLPALVALSAERIDPMNLHTLEGVVVHLGRAIVEHDMDGVKERTREFFTVIAAGTGNPVIGEVIHSLCASASLMFPRFLSFPDIERDKMFGDFVHIFNALRNKNPDEAREATLRKIVNTASAFSRLRNVPLPPAIRAAAALAGEGSAP